MKIIKKLSERIEEELEDAELYARMAVEWKDKDQALAKVFYDISGQELGHVNLLHGEVVKLIEKHRKEHGEPPASMMALYDYMHERHVAKANMVKVYHGQYRGE